MAYRGKNWRRVGSSQYWQHLAAQIIKAVESINKEEEEEDWDEEEVESGVAEFRRLIEARERLCNRRVPSKYLKDIVKGHS